jgi:hypothetical protein
LGQLVNLFGDWKHTVLDPASPPEAGQGPTQAGMGRWGGTDPQWVRVRFFVTGVVLFFGEHKARRCARLRLQLSSKVEALHMEQRENATAEAVLNYIKFQSLRVALKWLTLEKEGLILGGSGKSLKDGGCTTHGLFGFDALGNAPVARHVTCVRRQAAIQEQCIVAIGPLFPHAVDCLLPPRCA